MSTYFAILTKVGAAKLANAIALGTKLELKKMAVGDGNGIVPTPDREQTKLANEVRRADLNQLARDDNNTSLIIAEQVLPESVGGFWVREMGLLDADDDLCAVANCPPSYKPQLAEGSGRTQVVRMVLIVASADHVELKIDPSIVLATRDYADKMATGLIAAHEDKAHPHPQYFRSREEILPGGAAQQVLRKKSDNKNDWEWSDLAEFPGVAATIPTNKTLDVLYIKGIGLVEWVEIAGPGAFAGYRSPYVGRIEFGTSELPRDYELDLVGGLVSKTAYASLWAWAQQNDRVFANFVWSPGTFMFLDIDAETFRLPDLRNVFLRFAGIQADSGTSRHMGTFEPAAMQSHQHAGTTNAAGGHAHTYPYVPPFTRTGERGGSGSTGGLVDPQTVGTTSVGGEHSHEITIEATGGKETRPMNTAFNPRIHL